jgi:hypothetical protein
MHSLERFRRLPWPVSLLQKRERHNFKILYISLSPGGCLNSFSARRLHFISYTIIYIVRSAVAASISHALMAELLKFHDSESEISLIMLPVTTSEAVLCSVLVPFTHTFASPDIAAAHHQPVTAHVAPLLLHFLVGHDCGEGRLWTDLINGRLSNKLCNDFDALPPINSYPM